MEVFVIVTAIAALVLVTSLVSKGYNYKQNVNDFFIIIQE